MDRPFLASAWQPTKLPEPDDPELSEETLTTLISRLNDQTKQIYTYPYDPNTWLTRARTLTRLRYPELAVGDAHKASLLAENHLSVSVRTGPTCGDSLKNPDDDGEQEIQTEWKWRLGHRMGFRMLQPRQEGDGEQIDMLEMYLAQVRGKAEKVKFENLASWPVDDECRFRRRKYPWMAEEYSRRSDEIVEQVNLEFERIGRTALPVQQGTTCLVKRHAFGPPSSFSKKDTNDVLGVFAARDLAAGETILVDRTRIWGCNGPGTDGSLANLHNAKGCLDPIHPNDEDDDAMHCLRWIRDQTGRSAAAVLLDVRILLSCIQDNVAHPLEHPLVARLTPAYGKDKIETFSLHDDISIPLLALQKVGVDIFANPNFDTWVLFTLSARTSNNSCGDPMTEMLAPLFSLFNHSCEPNCSWSTSEDHRTITVKVKGKEGVQEGQQLFVEYDGFVADEGLDVRRKRLWRWLDGPCGCGRCLREERGRLEGRWNEGRGGSEGGGERVDEKIGGTSIVVQSQGDGVVGDDGGAEWDVPKESLPVL